MEKRLQTRLRPVVLPAEVRVREFDAKLLLACCLAERGVPVYLGQRTEVDLSLGRLPPSVYVSKGLTRQSYRHLAAARGFGHEVVAWDEEAICYLTRDIYIGRRVGAETMALVSHLVAWGDDNVELWRDAPGRGDTPMHPLGNPRADLLRPELRPLLEDDVAALRDRFGRFVLLNSNFGSANNMIPHRTRFRADGDLSKLSRTDRIGYNAAQAEYKRTMFMRMLEVPAALARAFPDVTVIVRPHPAENHGAWQDACRGLPNAHVVFEGSVLPWIAASACVVHSSCTTGLEAFLLDTPALALRYRGGHPCDDDLPNLVSHSAAEVDDLAPLVGKAVEGRLGVYENAGASRRLIAEYITGLDGALASERIAEFLAGLSAAEGPAAPGPLERASFHARAGVRRIKRWANSWRDDHTAGAAWRQHQFAVMSAGEVDAMIAGFARCLGRFESVRARRVGTRLFTITCDAPVTGRPPVAERGKPVEPAFQE